MKTFIGTHLLALGAVALVALSGCSSSSSCLESSDGNCGGDNPGGPGTEVTCADGAVVQTSDDCSTHGGLTGQANACAPKSYKGFEGTSVDVGATAEEAGKNRLRIKPFDVIGSEIKRVMNVDVSSSLTSLADTFGAAPIRWYDEPSSNAVSTIAMYEVAFEACLTYTATPAEFAAAPAQDTATAACTAMERKFWSRTPNPTEISACANNAVVNTVAEKDARRRWAYTCAAVLSAAGFATY